MASRGPPASAASTSRAPLKLSPELLNRFKPAKVFADAADRSVPLPNNELPQVGSLAFDDGGEKCVTSGEDESFALWDVRQGKKVKTFYSKKYGIGHVRFTHRAGNIIHTSTKVDHAIRYHAMHDNKYLSYFRGHEAMVRSIQMSPANDCFISSSDDMTVRLWDLRSPTCRGLLNDIGGSAIVAFDNTGNVFAVACSQTQTIALYSHNQMDHAPFTHAPIIDHALADISVPPPIPIITSVSFSNDGMYILLGTSSNFHYVLDAFSLGIVRRLTGHQGLGEQGIEPNRGKSGEEVCWTGDAKWVMSGSADGSVCMWDLTPPAGQEKLQASDVLGPGDVKPNFLNMNGNNDRPPTMQPTIRLQNKGGAGAGATRAVRFNPKLCMMATGGDDLTLWLPEKDDKMLVDEGF